MVKLKRSSDFEKQFERNDGHGHFPTCIVCGRLIKTKVKKMIYLDNDYATALTPDEADVMPDNMGVFPIGNECLKKQPELNDYILILDEDLKLAEKPKRRKK